MPSRTTRPSSRLWSVKTQLDLVLTTPCHVSMPEEGAPIHVLLLYMLLDCCLIILFIVVVDIHAVVEFSVVAYDVPICRLKKITLKESEFYAVGIRWITPVL